jgi:inner membrane protein
MATSVGHYLLGLAIATVAARGATERAQAPWWALIACAPDLDVLPGLLVGNLSRYHHGASHSLAAAGLVAMAAAAVVGRRRRQPALRMAAVVFVLYASHAVLDGFTLDTGPPVGVPFLWPWSHETFQAPWPLLPDVQHTGKPLVSAHNALLMVREVVVFAPLVGLAFAAHAATPCRRRAVTWLWAAGFVAAAGLSFASLD